MDKTDNQTRPNWNGAATNERERVGVIPHKNVLPVGGALLYRKAPHFAVGFKIVAQAVGIARLFELGKQCLYVSFDLICAPCHNPV